MSEPNLHRDIGKLQGTLEAFTTEVRGWRAGIESRLSAAEGKIEKIEKDKAEHQGAVKAARLAWGTLSGVAGLLAGMFGSGYIGR